jgi:predicted transposase/invertase (TIGR01784 family)
LIARLIRESEKYDLKEIIYAKNTGRVDSMLTDVIANAKNYEKNLVKKGRVEGEKEAKIEMVKKMLIDGESIEKIVKYSELTEAEIREIEKTL